MCVCATLPLLPSSFSLVFGHPSFRISTAAFSSTLPPLLSSSCPSLLHAFLNLCHRRRRRRHRHPPPDLTPLISGLFFAHLYALPSSSLFVRQGQQVDIRYKDGEVSLGLSPTRSA